MNFIVGDLYCNHVGTPFRRRFPAVYADGSSTLARNGVNPRAVTQELNDGSETRTESRVDIAAVYWGQLLAHDMAYVPPHASETVDYDVTGDPVFDSFGYGDTKTMTFQRGDYIAGSPRNVINGVSSWLDGSVIYGSDSVTAAALRTNGGTGHLLALTADGNLPRKSDIPSVATISTGAPDADLYVSGDVRVNENVVLATLHTLLAREHNRQAQAIMDGGGATAQEAYEGARRIVSGIIQKITVTEWWSAFFGAISPFTHSGYDDTVSGATTAEFAALGEIGFLSMMPSTIDLRNGTTGLRSNFGVALNRNFGYLASKAIELEGIEGVLIGLNSRARYADAFFQDDFRHYWKVDRSSPNGFQAIHGSDQIAEIIFRGRDLGIPDYAVVRVGLGHFSVNNFDQATETSDLAASFRTLYGDDTSGIPDTVDAAAGMMAESAFGATTPQTVYNLWKYHLESTLRNDAFYWDNPGVLSAAEHAIVSGTTFASLVGNNTYLSNTDHLTFTRSGADCRGVPGGDYIVDECGVCLPVSAEQGISCRDCEGVPNGPKIIDACNECNDPASEDFSSSCKDCAGVPNGFSVEDLCGVCRIADGPDKDPNFSQGCLDCNGDIGGFARIDACGGCSLPGSISCSPVSLVAAGGISGGTLLTGGLIGIAAVVAMAPKRSDNSVDAEPLSPVDNNVPGGGNVRLKAPLDSAHHSISGQRVLGGGKSLALMESRNSAASSGSRGSSAGGKKKKKGITINEGANTTNDEVETGSSGSGPKGKGVRSASAGSRGSKKGKGRGRGRGKKPQ